jgi:hypothetical protein
MARESRLRVPRAPPQGRGKCRHAMSFAVPIGYSVLNDNVLRSISEVASLREPALRKALKRCVAVSCIPAKPHPQDC